MSNLIEKIKSKLSFDLKELLKFSGVAFISNAVGFLFLYILTLLITNNFGAAVYGKYSLFINTVRMFTIFAVFGVDIMSLRYISEYFSKSQWNKINELTYKSYTSILITSSGLAFLCYLLSPYLSEALKSSTVFCVLIGLTVIPFSFIKLHSQCFRGQKKIFLFSSFEFILVPLISIILLGVYFLWGKGIQLDDKFILIGINILVVCILAFAAFVIWTKARSGKTDDASILAASPSLKNVGHTLKSGFPFLLARTSTYLAAWSMLFLLNYFRTSEEVGIYEAALKIAQLAILPLSAINAIAAPKFSAMYGKNNIAGLEKTAQQATAMSVIASLPVALLIFFFSYQIMGYYGSEFEKGVWVLRVLALGQVLNAFTGPVGQMMQMTENQHTHQFITFSTLLASLALGVYLISNYGLFGTALTYCFFVVVNNGTCFLWINLKLKIRTLPNFKF